MTDPDSARRLYKDDALKAAGLLHAAEEARRRLAEAEDERIAAYASVDAELAHLDGLEDRAAGIWKELTTRFGPHAAGPFPGPDDGPAPARGQQAEDLLAAAHMRVREPVDHLLTARYVRMGVLGFAAALVVATLGLELTRSLHELGRIRLLALLVPVVAGPWIGHLAATAWIRLRTSHEEQEYAVDTATAGTFGGGGVWLIALIFVIVRLVT